MFGLDAAAIGTMAQAGLSLEMAVYVSDSCFIQGMVELLLDHSTGRMFPVFPGGMREYACLYPLTERVDQLNEFECSVQTR